MVITNKTIVKNGRIVRPEVVQKYPFADCKNCPLNLRRTAKNSVILPTEEDAPRILAIGEGPGRNEISMGEIFIGDSGKLLREAIRDKGLEKYGVVLTNALMCDPSPIKPLDDDTKERKAEKQELWQRAVSACSRRLANDIKQADPELILVFGNEALKAVTPEVRKGIMSMAGSYYEANGRTYLYMLHPAFILRSEEPDRHLPVFLDHMNEARLFFEGEPFEMQVKIAKSLKDVRAFLKELEPFELITADTETTSFTPWDDGFGINPPATDVQQALAEANDYTLRSEKVYWNGQLISLQLCGDARTGYVIGEELLANPKVIGLLSDFLERHELLFHNAAFDLPWLRQYINPKLKARHDTMLMSYSMSEHPYHPLKMLSGQLLGVEDWSKDLDIWRPKRDVSFDNIPRELLYPYAGKDVVTPPAIMPLLYERMDKDDRRLYENWLMPVNNMFVEMSGRGIAVDVKELAKTNRELKAKSNELREFLEDEYGLRNPNSSKQVMDLLKGDPEDGGFGLDVPPEVGTGKGYLSTLHLDWNEIDRDEVEEWEADVSDFAGAVLEYRSTYKANNTYIKDVARSLSYETIIKSDDQVLCLVHPDFKIWATVTGRIVISNPTFTNYSKATGTSDVIRSVFKPRPGYVWMHYDYKQFELRIYASMTSDPKMMDVLLIPDEEGKPRDPHREVALQIYGPNYDELNRRAYGILRTITKTCVFGRLYGRGPAAMAAQLEIPTDEAKRVCSVIDEFWVSLPDYRSWVEDQIIRNQRLVNPLGRSRRFPLITSNNWHKVNNMGCNYLIQSTASDLNLAAIYHITQKFPDVHPLFTIHDSGELEIPEDKVDEYVPQIIEILEKFPSQFFENDKVPMLAEYKLNDRWDAE